MITWYYHVIDGATVRALPAGGSDALPPPAEPMFRRAMRELSARDAATYARRLEELAYLVNVVMAGATQEGHAFRPFEATEVVVAACDVGLERASRGKEKDATRVLSKLAADQLFRIGWGARTQR